MKYRYVVLYGFRNDLVPQDEWIIDAIREIDGIKAKIHTMEGFGGFFTSIDVECGEDRLDAVLEVLRRGTNEVAVRKEAVWTRRDVEDAEFLFLSLCTVPAGSPIRPIPVEPAGPGPCSHCLAGYRLGPTIRLGLASRTLRRGVLELLHGVILLDEAVRNALVAAGCSAADFSPAACVSERGSRDYGVRWLLQPVLELPPLHAFTKGLIRVDPCASCGRNAWYNTPKEPFEPAVERAALERVFDTRRSGARAVRTYECVGEGRRPKDPGAAPPTPMLVVNQPFRRALLDATDVRAAWVPVQVI